MSNVLFIISLNNEEIKKNSAFKKVFIVKATHACSEKGSRYEPEGLNTQATFFPPHPGLGMRAGHVPCRHKRPKHG